MRYRDMESIDIGPEIEAKLHADMSLIFGAVKNHKQSSKQQFHVTDRKGFIGYEVTLPPCPAGDEGIWNPATVVGAYKPKSRKDNEFHLKRHRFVTGQDDAGSLWPITVKDSWRCRFHNLGEGIINASSLTLVEGTKRFSYPDDQGLRWQSFDASQLLDQLNVRPTDEDGRVVQLTPEGNFLQVAAGVAEVKASLELDR